MVELAGDLGYAGEAAHVGCGIGSGGGRRRLGGVYRGRGRSGRWRQRGRTGVARRDSRGHVEALQILVALFFSGKEFLNSLQPLHGLVAHAVLNQDLRLQHQVLQRGSAQGRTFTMCGLFGRLADGVEARRNHPEACVVYFAFQQIEALQVTGLIGIDFGGAVQAIGGFAEFAGAAIEIEQLQQGLAVVVFTVGRVVELAEEFENWRRRPVPCGNVLHDGDELAALAAAALELLQFAGQLNGRLILLGVEQLSDQGDHLLHSGRILLKKLPDQRLSFGVAAGSDQG